MQTADRNQHTWTPTRDITPYRRECHRIDFEAWARTNGADLTRTGKLAPAFNIDYLCGYTQAAWAAFVAAREGAAS